MQLMFFQVNPDDPRSFGAVAALLLVTGLAAAFVPARRASRVDPMTALRMQ
jgi:ABC-type lipoprotein release transport system permease subunit